MTVDSYLRQGMVFRHVDGNYYFLESIQKEDGRTYITVSVDRDYGLDRDRTTFDWDYLVENGLIEPVMQYAACPLKIKQGRET